METIAEIKIEKLVFPHAERPALKNIDLTIKPGDFLVITGGVASGKSVLLHSITGAIPHFHNAELTGKVTIMGQDIKHLSLNRMPDFIGYMMQEPHNQLISQDVYEDVAFGLGNLGIPFEQIEQAVKNTLDFVGLSGYENRQTVSLSGGEAQRVVLAGVLALNAPILVLDQPTAELDPRGRNEVYKRLGLLNKTRNLTIVLVMDRIEEVLYYANRVIFLKDGEIVKELTPAEYYREQIVRQTERLKYLTFHADTFNSDQRMQNECFAKISNVSYYYKNNFPGCENINLEIYKGDLISIVGLNGSGKSTLAKMLIGLLKPAKGDIKVFNLPLNKENLAEIRRSTGFLFQNPDHQIFAATLEEEVGFSLKLRGEQTEVINQKVDQCLDFVGLLDYKKLHPQRLSRGQRQLLALASVLAGDPEFIIADEPTSGLDENQGYMIIDKLYDLSKAGKTILFITHDLKLAKAANRVVALHNHHIQLDIPVSQLEDHLETLQGIGLDFQNVISLGEVNDGTF